MKEGLIFKKKSAVFNQLIRHGMSSAELKQIHKFKTNCERAKCGFFGCKPSNLSALKIEKIKCATIVVINFR